MEFVKENRRRKSTTSKPPSSGDFQNAPDTWADFRSTKAAVKAHTIIDLRGSIPVFVHITTGKVHDVKILDMIHWPAGAIVVVDRGYLDFTRLQALHQRQVSFVIRAKDNMRYTRVAWRDVDKSTGLRSDQSILLATPKSRLAYPDRLRRVSYRDPETDKFLVFLTNRFDLPALTIAEIYRNRWAVETFSNGSSKTCRSNIFSATPSMPSSRRFGSPSASILLSSSRANA
ncbi:MAG: IS4 family transposase [Sulfuritalea sp.]|nr:IS4 family transposase [Sulfuritalea sp.]